MQNEVIMGGNACNAMFDALANALAFDVLGLDSSSRTAAAVEFFIILDSAVGSACRR